MAILTDTSCGYFREALDSLSWNISLNISSNVHLFVVQKLFFLPSKSSVKEFLWENCISYKAWSKFYNIKQKVSSAANWLWCLMTLALLHKPLCSAKKTNCLRSLKEYIISSKQLSCAAMVGEVRGSVRAPMVLKVCYAIYRWGYSYLKTHQERDILMTPRKTYTETKVSLNRVHL